MTCPRCGANVAPDAQFCSNCGTRFSAPQTPVDTAPTTQVLWNAPQQQQQQEQWEAQTQQGPWAAAPPQQADWGQQQADWGQQQGAWGPQPGQQPPRRGLGRSTAIPLAIVIVAALVIVGAGVFAWQRSHNSPASGSSLSSVNQGGATGNGSPSPSGSSPSGTSASSSASSTVMSDAAALAAMNAERTKDLGQISFGTTYSAQLSTKWVGLSDPNFNNGRPVTNADIWAQFQQLQSDPRWTGNQVVLLKAGDIGTIKANQANWWIIVAVLNLPSASAATSWCQQIFPGQTGTTLLNNCMAREMDHGHY